MSKPVLACVEDYEKHAHSVLPRNALDYYASGSNSMTTLTENKLAFKRFVALAVIWHFFFFFFFFFFLNKSISLRHH